MSVRKILGGTVMVVSVVLTAVSSQAGCAPQPLPGCRLTELRHQTWMTYFETRKTDPDDVFTWAWRGGKETDQSDFKNPATTSYAFCIYDASDRPQPVVGASPDDASAWQKLDNGYLYRVYGDQKLRKLILRAQLNGRGKVLAHGDSTTVTHVLPFVTPVVVQMQEADGNCWESDFSSPMRNDSHVFRIE